MILVFVYPSNRKKAHDTFETTHRFLGWTAVALEWGLVYLLVNDFRGDRAFTAALFRSPPFWLTVVQTGEPQLCVITSVVDGPLSLSDFALAPTQEGSRPLRKTFKPRSSHVL